MVNIFARQVVSLNDSSLSARIAYCGLYAVLWALGVEVYLILPVLKLPF